MDNNDERKIYDSFFTPKVKEGPVTFLVVGARYDTLKSKSNKDLDIVKVKVELQERNKPNGDKLTESINVFINNTPDGPFHRFVKAAKKATQSTSFVPSALIGLRGEGTYYRKKPENYDFSFPNLVDWVFYLPSEKVDDALSKYTGEGFDLTEEDIDFEDPIDDVQDENDQKEGE